MRVAHIITRMIIGGAQENTLHTCEDLRRVYNDDVLLITGPAEGPEGDLIVQGRGVGVDVCLIESLRRNLHPLRDWSAYRELKRRIAEFRPEVVHTHSAKGGFLGRLAASSLRIPAIVHTVHGAPFHPYQSGLARSLFRRCERMAARRCHKLLSVCDAMTELLVSSQVAPREKFCTIYSGMDVEPFLAANDSRSLARRELGIDDDQVVIGKIARFFRLKGQEFLLRAAPRLIEACPSVRFLMVGDGILKEKFESQVAAAGLIEYFIFVGLVPPERVPDMIGALDVLVHTSLREGLARTLPQALIAAKPVVSYDIDRAREVVINEETGFLVPPRSVSELSDALARLANDSELRRQLGQNGRQRLVDPFRHEVMTAQIRQVYEALLDDSAG